MHVSENDMRSMGIHSQQGNNNFPPKNFGFYPNVSVQSVKSASHDLLSGPRFSEVLPGIKID